MIDYSDESARNHRLDTLLASVPLIVNHAIRKHMQWENDRFGPRRLAGIVTMFSGGDDSTVLAHIMRERTDYFGHANTGIGIEATREFVRKTCAEWGVPLIERSPLPHRSYEAYVRSQGFPGPGRHDFVFNRIKGSPFEQIAATLVQNPYRERVLFVAGRRFFESSRRISRKIPLSERKYSTVWVSPLRGWTTADLQTYRRRFPDVPHNQVAADIGMSGECLCGAFAHPGELDQLRSYAPAADAVAEIDRLAELASAAGLSRKLCTWGRASVYEACRNACNR